MTLNKGKAADLNEILKFLYAILNVNISKEDVLKIMEIEAEITGGCPYLLIIQRIAKVPLILKKNRIEWNNTSIDDADKISKGWNPNSWNLTEVTRAILLISWAQKDPENIDSYLCKYYKSAEAGEQASILKCLSLFPNADKLESVATEGLRSNVKVVFEAISLNNRYPSLFFTMDLWNQMILKAVTQESTLSTIVNLKEKSNYNLAVLLCDVAYEKWKEEKLINPEVWQIVSPFINESLLKILTQVLSEEDENNLEAILLSCYESRFPKAQTLVNSYPQTNAEIVSGKVNWETIVQKWNTQKMLYLSK